MTTGTYGAYDASPWRGGYEARGGGERGWNPKPLWIALTVLAFIAWWPVGLLTLAFLIGSGRMGCRGRRFAAGNGWGGAPWSNWKGFCAPRTAPGSGNRAFDESRAETLRRLEDEQKDFSSFLERLRFAKDKAEFDAFMAERRNQPPAPGPVGDQPQG